MRLLLLVAGSVCVALAMLGVFLPLLPTTPFLLLAAACYARGSQRFLAWLIASPTFGPLISEWHTCHSIPYRTKLSAIALMSTTLTVSVVYFVQPLWLQLVLAAIGLGLAIWMYGLPSCDRPRQQAQAAAGPDADRCP